MQIEENNVSEVFSLMQWPIAEMQQMVIVISIVSGTVLLVGTHYWRRILFCWPELLVLMVFI